MGREAQEPPGEGGGRWERLSPPLPRLPPLSPLRLMTWMESKHPPGEIKHPSCLGYPLPSGQGDFFSGLIQTPHVTHTALPVQGGNVVSHRHRSVCFNKPLLDADMCLVLHLGAGMAGVQPFSFYQMQWSSAPPPLLTVPFLKPFPPIQAPGGEWQ